MKQFKKFIGSLFILAIFIALNPMNVNAEQYKGELWGDPVIMEPVQMETAAETLAMFTLNNSGPQLKDGNYADWIDRIDNLPDYALEFYQWLEEGANGDKIKDDLINIKNDEWLISGEYAYTVEVVNTTVEVPLDYSLAAPASAQIPDPVERAAFEANEKVYPYILAVLSAFDRDHPEVFWLSGEVVTGYGIGNIKVTAVNEETQKKTLSFDVVAFYYLYYDDEKNVFDIRVEGMRDEDIIYDTITDMNSIADGIISEASNTAKSRKEKLDYYNDWLTKHNAYNSSEDLNKIGYDTREITSALNGRIGTEGPVCEAYARAFKMLCDRSGIPCVLVSGLSDGAGHMWNNVQMPDNKWYAVDVTWNDPLVTGESKAVSGYENDDFLLVGSETVNRGYTFADEHEVTNNVFSGSLSFTNGPLLEKDSYVDTRPELKFSGASLNLHDDLSIKYMVKTSLFEAGAYENPYVIFKMNEKEAKVTEYTTMVNDGVEYFVFRFKNIAPHQMNDTVYATLYGTYDGTEYASETVEYGVGTYCYNMLEKRSPSNDPKGEYAKLRSLLVDLLGYGAKSQIYVNYKAEKPEDLAGSMLTEEQIGWGTVGEIRELTSVLNTKYTIIENPTAKWRGAGLNLLDSIRMRFLLQTDELEGVTVKVTSNVGTWNIGNDKFKAVTVNGEAMYEVFFSGLNAAQLSETVYVTAYKNGVAISNTVCYSVESYVSAKQKDGNTKLVELVKAMMKYGDSAKAYVTE